MGRAQIIDETEPRAIADILPGDLRAYFARKPRPRNPAAGQQLRLFVPQQSPDTARAVKDCPLSPVSPERAGDFS